jgi:hypothetical protein
MIDECNERRYIETLASEHPPASEVEETNSERNEENSEKRASPALN